MKPEKIITTLESHRPRLTRSDRDVLWSTLEKRLSSSTSIPSPFIFNLIHRKTMAALLIAILIIAGGGGTALASDSARPGDLLFPLERTLEDARLRLAFSDESRNALIQSLTEERLEELREIIDEEIIITPSNIVSGSIPESGTASSTDVFLGIEADVFSDTTVVKVELNDQKFYFETTAQNREGVIVAIQERFAMLTTEQIEKALSFELEDRASRPKDRGIVSFNVDGQTRVNDAVQAILGFLDETTDPEDISRTSILSVISGEVDSVLDVERNNGSTHIDSDDNRLRIKMNDDGDSRIEVRNGDTRIRIDEEDGEIRVRTRGEDTSNDSVESTVPKIESVTMNSVTSLEIEADIFTDVTVVTIEINGQKVTFETTAETRDQVVRAIQDRFSVLTETQIIAALSLENEDRAYREKEKEKDSIVDETVNDVSEDDDWDDDWDDEDDDEDNKGEHDDDEDKNEDDDEDD